MRTDRERGRKRERARGPASLTLPLAWCAVAMAWSRAQRLEPELVAKEKRILEQSGATQEELKDAVRAQWEKMSNGRSSGPTHQG